MGVKQFVSVLGTAFPDLKLVAEGIKQACAVNLANLKAVLEEHTS